MIEIEDQVLPRNPRPPLAEIAGTHLEEKGIRLHLGRKVSEIRKNGEDGGLEVIMSDGSIQAELVITAAGVRPNTEIARSAGLLVSRSGAIVVTGCFRLPTLISTQRD